MLNQVTSSPKNRAAMRSGHTIWRVLVKVTRNGGMWAGITRYQHLGVRTAYHDGSRLIGGPLWIERGNAKDKRRNEKIKARHGYNPRGYTADTLGHSPSVRSFKSFRAAQRFADAVFDEDLSYPGVVESIESAIYSHELDCEFGFGYGM